MGHGLVIGLPGRPADHQVVTVKKPPAALVLVPGRSIGDLHVGMSRDAVHAVTRARGLEVESLGTRDRIGETTVVEYENGGAVMVDAADPLAVVMAGVQVLGEPLAVALRALAPAGLVFGPERSTCGPVDWALWTAPDGCTGFYVEGDPHDRTGEDPVRIRAVAVYSDGYWDDMAMTGSPVFVTLFTETVEGCDRFEELPVEDLTGGTVRLLGSPGFVPEVAAGDVVRLLPDGRFDMVLRGGNLCVQMFSDTALADGDVAWLQGEFARLGGTLDRRYDRLLGASVPVTATFPKVEGVLAEFAARTGVEWFFGNVYGPDGVTPLLWWESSTSD